MIIFLYGQDTYRSRRKLNEFVVRYKKIHKEGLGPRRFEGRDLDFRDFREEIESTSIFGERKLFILEDVFSNQEFKDWFIKNKKRILSSDSTILVYEGGRPDKRDKFFRFLIKYSKSQEFGFLKEGQLERWIVSELSRYNIKIQQRALSQLIDFVGVDLWRMANELRKLSSFKGENSVVGEEDVRALVKPKIESDIFKTINAVAEKDKKTALGLLRAHLKSGEPPLYLFSMIDFQFRNLLVLKDLLERRLPPYSSGLHPYAIKKTLPLLRKFTLGGLKKIYQRLFELDLEIKSGKISPELGLDLFVMEI